MASVSIEQKKLEQLKQQLFGKSDSTYSISPSKLKAVSGKSEARTLAYDSTNLKADLIKIAILSLGALGLQLGLYFANLSGLVKLF